MLKQLSSANNKDKNTSNSGNILNDSCLYLLKQHCGAENSKQRELRGPKDTPEKSIASLPNKENEALKRKKVKQPTAAAVNKYADN